jgi:hypothetical protein
MRDLLGSRPIRRLAPAHVLVACALAAGVAVPASAREPEASAARSSGAAKHLRAQLRRAFVKKPRLALDKAFLKRAQAAGAILPFTIRLRRPYEGGPGDDVVELAWDAGATTWPLPGTMPAAPANSGLGGALTYEWDYSADTTGYATLGTVETVIGNGISLTGTGFPIAVADPSATCDKAAALDATGVTFTSAGVRFGTVNPFSGQVNGTINLRTRVRTTVTPCGAGATPVSLPVAAAGTADPPLPLAFQGSFNISPSVASDGKVRLGLLKIAVGSPQRSTFGLVKACTDAAAADGCGAQSFPVRTKVLSLNAEVLAGDVMPGPPGDPA